MAFTGPPLFLLGVLAVVIETQSWHNEIICAGTLNITFEKRGGITPVTHNCFLSTFKKIYHTKHGLA